MITPFAPPRWIETLLASLGAQQSYCDAILGDLAEEFVIRVEEQGVRTARRWYRWEALRAAPHLLGNWARHLTAGDGMRLGLAIIVAGIAFRLLAMAIPLVIVMSLGVKPDSLGIVAVAWHDVLMETSALKWTGLILLRTLPIGVGYIAASLNHRGRIPAALALGAIDAVFAAYAFAFAPNVSPVVRVLVPITTLGTITLGGVLRALMDRSHRGVVRIS